MMRPHRTRCKLSISLERRFLLHILGLTVVTFLVILPICSYKLKFSIYHPLWPRNKEKDQQIMRNQNDLRVQAAEKFLKGRQSKQVLYGKGKETIDVGISIITVSRNRHAFDSYEPRYLTQVVAKFLELFSDATDLHFSYQLFICNVDDDPGSYYEVQKLATKIETFYRFPVINRTNPINRPYRTTDETLEKEKQDYVFCGEEVIKRNISNVFLVEDDALPHDDIVIVLEHILQHYITDSFHAGKTHNVSYFKFYHPDRLLGFISLEVERIPELLAMSIFLALLLTYFYLKLRPKVYSHKETVWIGFFLYSCLLFIFIGRQPFLELRRISHSLYQVTPAPSCCTPAMLYPKDSFLRIASHFKSVRCKGGFGKDIALEAFRKKAGLTARMVQPNLFTHIGMYSSLRDQVLDPFIV